MQQGKSIGLAGALALALATSGWLAGTQVATATEKAAARPAPVTVYTVVYTAGPNWKPGLPPDKQDLAGHFKYIGGLFGAGALLANGPTLDDKNGFYVFLEDNEKNVDRIIANDPAVKGGVLALAERAPWRLMVEAMGAKVRDGNRLFVMNYRPGPNWRAGKSLPEQDIAAHMEYVGELARNGRLLAGGPVSDRQGRYLIAAADAAAASAIVARDPGVAAGVFRVESKPWHAFNRQSVAQAQSRR